MELILQREEFPPPFFVQMTALLSAFLTVCSTAKKATFLPLFPSITYWNLEQTKPMLTTIDIPKKEMAHHACEPTP